MQAAECVRRLLVLGSDAADSASIEAALAALAGLGQLEVLTAIRITPDASAIRPDPERGYRNVLVRLDCDLERDALRAQTRRIERGLGRRAGDPRVPIDIDLLATHTAGRWVVDTRALQKGETRRAHVRALLAEAGIRLDPDPASVKQAT